VEKWVQAFGSEKLMQVWTNGHATDRMDDKIKMNYILLGTNIPVIHHSNIPYSDQIRKPKKIHIISRL